MVFKLSSLLIGLAIGLFLRIFLRRYSIRKSLKGLAIKSDWTIYLHENLQTGEHLILKVDDLDKELVRIKTVRYARIDGGLSKRRFKETIILDNGDIEEVRKILTKAFQITFHDRPGNLEGSVNNIYIIQNKIK